MSRQITNQNKISLTENQRAPERGGKLLFTRCMGQQAALLVSDNRLLAAQFFPEERSRLGAVYIAKVKNVAKNLNACFVEIDDAREICFLSKKDGAYPFLLNRAWDGRILEGDEFPVQVARDAQKSKQPSVTTLLSLSNEYFALSVGDAHTGFSAKLDAAQKKKIRELLKRGGYLTPPPIDLLKGGQIPVGLVVRTRAAEFLQDENAAAALARALEALYERWEALFQTARYRTCFSCLLAPPEPFEDALSYLAYPEEYEEILTDDEELYGRLKTAKNLPPDKVLRLYGRAEQEELPLAKLYGLESKMRTALERRVWLKSGGYLVIDQTEALTVIDVNSGKYEASKSSEETCVRINREAAREIALQLRLRNLSGIIIVDFINMRSREAQAALLKELSVLAAADRQRTEVVDMTPLGLVEITRKKARKPLSEQLENRWKREGNEKETSNERL